MNDIDMSIETARMIGKATAKARIRMTRNAIVNAMTAKMQMTGIHTARAGMRTVSGDRAIVRVVTVRVPMVSGAIAIVRAAMVREAIATARVVTVRRRRVKAATRIARRHTAKVTTQITSRRITDRLQNLPTR